MNQISKMTKIHFSKKPEITAHDRKWVVKRLRTHSDGMCQHDYSDQKKTIHSPGIHCLFIPKLGTDYQI